MLAEFGIARKPTNVFRGDLAGLILELDCASLEPIREIGARSSRGIVAEPARAQGNILDYSPFQSTGGNR